MCGSVRHRDAESTRNKLRNNKSHLQIVGKNRMNGSVRDASVLFELHDGHSSIILNQLSHFFNQRNSGNFLTALRMRLYSWTFRFLVTGEADFLTFGNDRYVGDVRI